MNIKYADFFHLAPQFADRFEHLAPGEDGVIDRDDKRVLAKFRRLLEKLRQDLLAAPSRTSTPLDAQAIAFEVLGHIDTMYPAMWNGVPKTARVSLRNTIVRAIARQEKS
jgi:hypothetical protein